MALVTGTTTILDEEYYRNYIRTAPPPDRPRRYLQAAAGRGSGIAPALQAAEAVTRPGITCLPRQSRLRDAIYTLWADDGTETPQFAALGPVTSALQSTDLEKTPDTERIKRAALNS